MADKKGNWLYRREMKRQKEGLRARFKESFQAGRDQSKAEREKADEKNYAEMIRIYERSGSLDLVYRSFPQYAPKKIEEIVRSAVQDKNNIEE